MNVSLQPDTMNDAYVSIEFENLSDLGGHSFSFTDRELHCKVCLVFDLIFSFF
jgi:hypothetical protein